MPTPRSSIHGHPDYGPLATPAMERERTAQGFALANGVDVIIATNSFRAVRWT